MNYASKWIVALIVTNLGVFAIIGVLNAKHHPAFLTGRYNTLMFAHGSTYSSSGIEAFKQFYTVDQNWYGRHDLHSSFLSQGDKKTLKLYSSVYFWGNDLFSTSSTSYSKDYTPSVEPDVTEAHLIDQPVRQFFQTLYQDRYNFCYVSLLTSSVQCITADQ
ncbi:hypothetical protein OPW41_12290 [Vibrio europaeus]|uniref:Uncharacterized protein n=4 Tax=Vibrionaceae TaxID=641 RepID=A0A0H3ZQR5_VIBSP|nr:hypothetical protein [Vibrio europaeus]AKN37871.1 hypothetical protein [Vibrio sp. FF_482]AKN38713.1 hypothetical protein [Vibrio splendidus]AKN39583.1 hypothetical protein [Enterovibrio norvegicus]MDC5721866.1 hypothetical protein [Vibrio europaeus]MDC5758253.1 hypothetical protein [Vibrio europaeus]